MEPKPQRGLRSPATWTTVRRDSSDEVQPSWKIFSQRIRPHCVTECAPLPPNPENMQLQSFLILNRGEIWCRRGTAQSIFSSVLPLLFSPFSLASSLTPPLCSGPSPQRLFSCIWHHTSRSFSSQMPSPQRRRRPCGTRSAPCWRRLTGSWRSCSPTTAQGRRYEKWGPGRHGQGAGRTQRDPHQAKHSGARVCNLQHLKCHLGWFLTDQQSL